MPEAPKHISKMTEMELQAIGYIEQEKLNSCQQNLSIIRQELNSRMQRNGEQEALADGKNIKALEKSIVKKK